MNLNFKYYKTERLVVFIIGLSVVLSFIEAYAIHPLIERLLEPLKSLIISTELFSVPFFMSLVLYYINDCGWKTRYFKWLINVWDLNGRYVGQLESSFKDSTENFVKKRCVIEIKQTASSIHTFAYFGDLLDNNETSSSHGASEELIQDSNGLFKLYYVFNNESETSKPELDNHTGTAKFKYYGDIKSFKGGYYNERKNTGTIEVKYEQQELLGRLVK